MTWPICHAGSVSTPPTPDDDARTTAQMPTSVRVGVVIMSLLAGLLLLNALLTWVSRATVARAIVAEGATRMTVGEAERFVVLWMLPYLILGLLLALSAWFLPRRLAWARWIGLAAAALLCLLTLFSVVTTRGITVASLLLLVLSFAAVMSMLAGGTATWVPRLRARR